MSQGQAIGIVSLLGALILFGVPALRRRRNGAPAGRYAVIWLAFSAMAFAIALLAGRH